jgi:dTDP-4-amino-4,6-dideoxygalactose transaminase
MATPERRTAPHRAAPARSQQANNLPVVPHAAHAPHIAGIETPPSAIVLPNAPDVRAGIVRPHKPKAVRKWWACESCLVNRPLFASSIIGAAMIPFNRPSLAGQELQYIAEVMHSGRASGDGQFTKRCHQLLEDIHPGSRALLTTSCTHALEMAAILLEIGPGDEVIVPSFTFVSTVNAFVLRGATPVFADIRPDTLNLDERRLETLVTPRTKAIVAVHYAGIGCEMDALVPFAAARGLHLVEDNAHGLFGRYRGRALGTFGRLAALSFHETKNVTCGEGGALLVNDPELFERAEIVREKGTNRSRFFRGEVDKYTWVDIGSSYLPSDLLAAFLYAQLEASSRIQAKRLAHWHRYAAELRDWAVERGVGLPAVPTACEQPGHLFYLVLPSRSTRDALIACLKARNICAVFHYVPLHLSPMGRRFGGRPGDCPVTEDTSDRLVRLPLSAGLKDEEQSRVIQAVLQFGHTEHGDAE